MPREILANRVTILEHKVAHLAQLPDRMASLEGQISQFREEVRVEFSAVRGEMKELHGIAMTRMDDLHGIAIRELRDGGEETRRQMRVLHEEVISRIALLDEGLNGRRRSGSAPGRAHRTKRRGPKG